MKPIVVASHMRSGTHLTIDLLRRNLPSVSARYLNLDQLAPHHGEPLPLGEFERTLAELGSCPLLKTHAPAPADGWFPSAEERSARARQLLETARVVYVVRDGRDVLVSLYYYMRHYDERVRGQRFTEFLRDRDDFFSVCPGFRGLDRVSAWARHVEGWLAQPHVVVVRYEDLLERLDAGFAALVTGLGLPAPERVAKVSVPAGLPRRLLRRALSPLWPRRVSTAVAPRLGVRGDAARHFSAEDEGFFRERAGTLLGRLDASGVAA